jgi:hypothetical protein
METVPFLGYYLSENFRMIPRPTPEGMAPIQPPLGNRDGIDGVSPHNAAPAAGVRVAQPAIAARACTARAVVMNSDRQGEADLPHQLELLHEGNMLCRSNRLIVEIIC